VAFYQLLVAARKQWFTDALSDALKELDQNAIKEQVSTFVTADAQQRLASAGLRDEYVFPLPLVLEAKPSLVGYYRMLLGAPQKSYYKGSTGMGMFKSMEELDIINEKQRANLASFCEAMAVPLAELVRQIPTLCDRDIREMPLLTYGAQLQGSNNTAIGKKAMQDIFLAINAIVKKHIVKKEPRKLTIRNASKRTVVVELSSDPDVSIYETLNGDVHLKVAIEVKGGTDVSNAHNRAGEAEKSHLKAKGKGFRDFWTIISKTGVDITKLKKESQTTTTWFDVAEVLARKGTDWEQFKVHMAGALGIPLN
jgi:hypothetical protein